MSCCKEDYLTQDRFAKNLGIEVIDVKREYARCKLELNENHLNGLGSIHGAVIFSLADITFAIACNSVKKSIGVHADIKYLKKPKGKILFSEAVLVSESNKMGNYLVNVYDNQNTHVAQFNSIAYRFDDKC